MQTKPPSYGDPTHNFKYLAWISTDILFHPPLQLVPPVTSETRWIIICSIFGHLHQRKFAHSNNFLCQSKFKILPNTKLNSKYRQRLLNFCQIGEISQGLVTLPVTEMSIDDLVKCHQLYCHLVKSYGVTRRVGKCFLDFHTYAKAQITPRLYWDIIGAKTSGPITNGYFPLWKWID